MNKHYQKPLTTSKKESDQERFARYKKTLLKIITQGLPECKVYLFGSRARKDHKQGSDIDIALDIGKEISSTKLYKIEDEIEETTIPLFVDLIDLQTATGDFKNEILKERILWKS